MAFSGLLFVFLLATTASSAPTGSHVIAAGWKFSLVLKRDGTVWGTGGNNQGQLGDGTNIARNEFVEANGMSGAKAIAANNYHSLVLKQDGTVWGAGRNYHGQLGDGTSRSKFYSNQFVQAKGVTGAQAIAAGVRFSLVLKRDGTVWGTGWNSYGQLGDGTTTDRNVFVQAKGVTGAVAIAAGDTFSLVLKRDGTVWGAGRNYYGQLGGTPTLSSRSKFVQAKGVTGIKAIAAGGGHSLVLKRDGTVWGAGWNSYGQLGAGTTTDRGGNFVQATGVSGVQAIAAGGGHSLVLKRDGTVWGTGRNSKGQLGDGTTTDRRVFVQAKGVTGLQAIGVTGAKDISVSGLNSLVLKQDGTVWGAGDNKYGQLGDPDTMTRRSIFVEVLSVNLCVCPGGTPKSGAECTQHGAAMCAHCNAGYIINTAQTKCADVVVVDG